jgi:hypothetical protein
MYEIFLPITSSDTQIVLETLNAKIVKAFEKNISYI